jgi:hypothetical protein
MHCNCSEYAALMTITNDKGSKKCLIQLIKGDAVARLNSFELAIAPVTASQVVMT